MNLPTSVVVVLLLMTMLSATALSEDIPLTCPDTARRELKDITRTFNCEVTLFPEEEVAVCHGYVSEGTYGYSEESSVDLAFKMLEQVPGGRAICVGLLNVSVELRDRHTSEVLMMSFDFNPLLAVGVLTGDYSTSNTNRYTRNTEREVKPPARRRSRRALTSLISTLTRGGDSLLRTNRCRSCRISILSDILNWDLCTRWLLSFWNYSSSLFRSQLNWVQSFYMEGSVERYPSLMWLWELRKTNIQSLKVVSMKAMYNDMAHVTEMPVLRKMIFDYVYVKEFHEDSFLGMPEMEVLILKQTCLCGIPEMIDRMPKLKILEVKIPVDECSFIIPTKELSALTDLQVLNLKANRIYSISGKLPPFPKLRILNLHSCRLSAIGRSDFTGYPMLEELILTKNRLTHIEENAFLSLKNLKILDLSANKLKELPVIYDCSLLLLDASQNYLTYLYNFGNTGTTVEVLNISFNRIPEWEDKYVFSLSYLMQSRLWAKKIDISNNLLSGLSETMIQSLDGIHEIDLGGNAFKCFDCRTIPFQKWLNTTSTIVNNSGTSDPLPCQSPARLKGTPVNLVQFDEELCLEKVRTTSLLTLIGVPVGVMTALVMAAAGVIYKYRAKIAYMLRLYKIRQRAQAFSKSVFNKYAFDAFICYSSQDRRFVLTRLAPLLEKGEEKYCLCLHERDFPLGSHIVNNIVGSIQHSRKTIVVLSEYFISSKWCKWELEMANHKMFNEDEHFLILIQLERLERSKLPRHLQFLMDTRTYLEWPSSGKKDEEQVVVTRLKKALGPSIFQRTKEMPPLLQDVMEDY